MICRILLLISLTSCVSGTFVVNVTQSSYQAKENHDITLEWTFTTNPNSSSTSLNIFCQLFTNKKDPVVYRVDQGVEVPEFQDEQFKGRVHCDTDAFREGRIRLHVSRLRIEDSGLYNCEVITDYGRGSGECDLDVTAVVDEPEPEKPVEWIMILIYCAVAVGVVTVFLRVFLNFRRCYIRSKENAAV